MVVVPAGEFMMGSPKEEEDHRIDEGPQHKVIISKPFAVSRFELTFDEWDACAGSGDCDPTIIAERMGTRPAAGDQRQLGRRPAICGMALQSDRSALPSAVRG